MLDMSHIQKIYRTELIETHALRDLSLSVSDGEFVAIVEAKRKNIDVSGALQQAKRYSRDFVVPDEAQTPGGPWDGHQLPIVFSSNGRPFLRQLATRSGIWFCVLRRPVLACRGLSVSSFSSRSR